MDYTIVGPTELGGNSEVGKYVILAEPFKGMDEKNGLLCIGENSIIRSHTVIYAGNSIGDNFHAGHHVLIRERNKIGRDVSIGSGSVVEHHVHIGDGVRIHSQVFVPEFTVLEDGVWIGPNVVFTNAKFPNQPDTKSNLEGVRVSKGAIIGANATILPGLSIGAGAMIGAGTVVTKNVPAGAKIYSRQDHVMSSVGK